jgi:hypothetical protein
LSRWTDEAAKISFSRACIFPIATYAIKTWTLINKSAEKDINTFEHKRKENPYHENYKLMNVGYYKR